MIPYLGGPGNNLKTEFKLYWILCVCSLALTELMIIKCKEFAGIDGRHGNDNPLVGPQDDKKGWEPLL